METTKQIETMSKQMQHITLEVETFEGMITSICLYNPRDPSATDRAQAKMEKIANELSTIKLSLANPNNNIPSTYHIASLRELETKLNLGEMTLRWDSLWDRHGD